MRAAVVVAVFAVALSCGPATAEPSPYRGLEARAIKALSDQEVSDLRAGKGMSLALAAELNGLPGPRHVLDLAEPLELAPDQTAAIQAMFKSMKTRAAALGSAIVDRESDLDQGFRAGTLDHDSLMAKVMAIAKLRGELRATHLQYHLTTRDQLNAQQLALYARLRGYDSESHKHQGNHQSN